MASNHAFRKRVEVTHTATYNYSLSCRNIGNNNTLIFSIGLVMSKGSQSYTFK